jgi:hypothetical protein
MPPLNAETMALRHLIQKAFSRVKLGQGMGLWQAQGVDDYADAATLAKLRGRDEKEDWSRISVEDLNTCDSSLCFLDDLGMRFHLPAFLIAALQSGYQGVTLISRLISRLTGGNRFSLLSKAQREAVRAFLRHIVDLPEYQFERRDVLRALNGYWAEDR